MSETSTYSVPGVHYGHCKAAITRELEAVAGVESVDVDLDSKRVSVTGDRRNYATEEAADPSNPQVHGTLTFLLARAGGAPMLEGSRLHTTFTRPGKHAPRAKTPRSIGR